MRYVIALALIGLALAVLTFLVWRADRRDKRAEQLRAQVRVELQNPDAAWLYGQGLSRQEIDLAFNRHNQLR